MRASCAPVSTGRGGLMRINADAFWLCSAVVAQPWGAASTSQAEGRGFEPHRPLGSVKPFLRGWSARRGRSFRPVVKDWVKLLAMTDTPSADPDACPICQTHVPGSGARGIGARGEDDQEQSATC